MIIDFRNPPPDFFEIFNLASAGYERTYNPSIVDLESSKDHLKQKVAEDKVLNPHEPALIRSFTEPTP